MKRWRAGAAIALLAIIAAGIGWTVWQDRSSTRLQAGIVAPNGRLEANPVEIATKLPGRLVEITPQEGDMVEAGAVVARIDATDIEHQLHQAEAQAALARQSLAAATAAISARQSDLTFARQEYDRTQALVAKGVAANDVLDQRRQQLDSATAALAAATAGEAEARAGIEAADAAVEHMRTQLADAAITAPIRGRVQYRLVEPGAVLPAGGKILSLVDMTDVSMTVFLPAADAGRLSIGDEARIVLDVEPAMVLPASVVFVSSEAQFTPKTVETASEREKLMFRVTLQLPKDVLAGLEERVLGGLRGIAYLRVDRAVDWPATLSVTLPTG